MRGVGMRLVALLVSVSAASPIAAAPSWKPPVLDVNQLQRRFTQSFPVASGCSWRTYRVDGSSRKAGVLREALSEAAGAGVCGATIYLAAGFYLEGPLAVTKPLILVGERGVSIGRLEAWGLEVSETRVDVLPEFVGGRAGTFVNPGRSDDPGRFRLGAWLAGQAARNDRLGGGVHQWVRHSLSMRTFSPLGTPLTECPGTGILLSGGAWAELYSANLIGNHTAGLVARGSGTFVNVASLGASLNGLVPSWGFTDINEAVDSTACFGAIDIADGAMLLGEEGSLFGNAPVGLVVRRQAVAAFSGLTVVASVTGAITGWGDNVSVVHTFLSLSSFSSTHAERAGILISDGSANLVDGTFSFNKYGIATDSIFYESGVSNTGNLAADLLHSGNLPVPNAPLDVPSPP